VAQQHRKRDLQGRLAPRGAINGTLGAAGKNAIAGSRSQLPPSRYPGALDSPVPGHQKTISGNGIKPAILVGAEPVVEHAEKLGGRERCNNLRALNPKKLV